MSSFRTLRDYKFILEIHLRASCDYIFHGLSQAILFTTLGGENSIFLFFSYWTSWFIRYLVFLRSLLLTYVLIQASQVKSSPILADILNVQVGFSSHSKFLLFILNNKGTIQFSYCSVHLIKNLMFLRYGQKDKVVSLWLFFRLYLWWFQ